MRPLKLQTNRAGVLNLLEEMARGGGTDLHLKVPNRPLFRIEDRLVPTNHERLTPGDLHQLALTVMELAREETPLATMRDLRVAFGVEGTGRFRAQISRQRGSFSIVVHRIATEPPALSDYGLGETLGPVLERETGLLLVGGARQRHAVMAAMVRHYNQSIYGHVVSIEDPVEYLHRDVRASVTQRELGADVASFREGLIAAMGQDPDALFVSDVPEAGDAEMVLRAAEEGLLVVAGVPTPDGADAVRAFARRFATVREDEIAARVSTVLQGVVVVPRAGPPRFGTVAAQERDDLRSGRALGHRVA